MTNEKKEKPAKLLRMQIEEKLTQLLNDLHGAQAASKRSEKAIRKAAKLLAEIELKKAKPKKAKATPAKNVKKAAPKPKTGS